MKHHATEWLVNAADSNCAGLCSLCLQQETLWRCKLDASRVPTPQLVQYFVGVLLLLAIRNQRGSLEDRWKQVPRQGRYNGNPIQIQLLLLFLLRSRKVATWQSLEDRTHEANVQKRVVQDLM
jgi:hypothetical protein